MAYADIQKEMVGKWVWLSHGVSRAGRTADAAAAVAKAYLKCCYGSDGFTPRDFDGTRGAERVRAALERRREENIDGFWGEVRKIFSGDMRELYSRWMDSESPSTLFLYRWGSEGVDAFTSIMLDGAQTQGYVPGYRLIADHCRRRPTHNWQYELEGSFQIVPDTSRLLERRVIELPETSVPEMENERYEQKRSPLHARRYAAHRHENGELPLERIAHAYVLKMKEAERWLMPGEFRMMNESACKAIFRHDMEVEDFVLWLRRRGVTLERVLKADIPPLEEGVNVIRLIQGGKRKHALARR